MAEARATASISRKRANASQYIVLLHTVHLPLSRGMGRISEGMYRLCALEESLQGNLF